MEKSSKKWSVAAEAYEAQRNLSQSDKLSNECQEILSFINSGEEWRTALVLLKASKKNILIGYKAGAHSESGYFFGENGFYRKTNFIDVQTSTEEILISPLGLSDNSKIDIIILDIATAFRNKFPEISFVNFIYAELDKIAEACPK